MGGYQWIFPPLLYISFLVAAVSEYHQMFTPIINISKPYWHIQSWQHLLLSHEAGIHWISTHMTMISLHNWLLALYKTDAHCCCGRPWDRDPVEGRLY